VVVEVVVDWVLEVLAVTGAQGKPRLEALVVTEHQDLRQVRILAQGVEEAAAAVDLQVP
jgi:hypothetical protein